MTSNQQALRLLPTHFRRVAFGMLFLSLALIALIRADLLTAGNTVSYTVAKGGILLSLLLLALTKNRIEDELTVTIRLKALASAFIFGVGYAILEPVVNFLFQDGFVFSMDAAELLLTMFIVYFLTFYVTLTSR